MVREKIPLETTNPEARGKSNEGTSMNEKPPGSSKKRIIIIIIVIIAFVLLAMIIGLAVGLRKSAGSTQTSTQGLEDGTVTTSTLKPTGTDIDDKEQTTRDPDKPTSKGPSIYRPVVVISLGAIRFKSIPDLKHLNTLKKTGVSAKFLRPVYPTTKYPNTYSIVTGLYPESHGIIDDIFYDLENRLKFNHKINSFWESAEPIWNTARKQGKITATYDWPGGNINIQGMLPNIVDLGPRWKNLTRPVDTMIQWMKKPEATRPELMFFHIDTTKFSVDLPEIDKFLEYLLDNLKKENLFDTTNLILINDHGLALKTIENMIVLQVYLTKLELSKMYVYDGLFPRISNKYKYGKIKNTHMDPPLISLEEIESRIQCMSRHLRINRKTDLPKRLHYGNNPKIDDLILDLDNGWCFSRTGYIKGCVGPDSGYDNIVEDMQAFFVAHGPDFKEGLEVDGFENIELVNLISDILKIQPPPNNGTRGRLHEVMKTPPEVVEMTTKPQQFCNTEKEHSDSLGRPESLSSTPVVLVERDEGRVNAYSQKSSRFLWTSFSTTQKITSIYSKPDDVSCTSGSQKFLPPPDLVGQEVWYFITNVVEEYRQKYGLFNVTAGPIYDFNANGLLDDEEEADVYTSDKSLVPTHHFLILSRCETIDKLNCKRNMEVLSFILPHNNNDSNCLLELGVIKRNLARVRDIELLTDMEFYTDFPTATRAKVQTFLPLDLWSSPSTENKKKSGEWIEQPCPSANACDSTYQPLVVISMNGFRADYMNRGMTPVFQRLSKCGVTVPFLRSSYPTETFPNHYSIVTGLYPESHGIVDTSMYDPDIKERFSTGSASSKDGRWWGGEPIWLTAKKQGKKDASYFWVGSDVEIQGEYPTLYRLYSGRTSYTDRVETVVDWLTNPKFKPDVVTLYFDEPDFAGHQFGPDSEEINQLLRKVDNVMRILMNELYQKNLHNCVNIMLLSDHGMAPTGCDRVNDLSTAFNFTELNQFFLYQGAFGRIATSYRFANRRLVEVENQYPVQEIISRIRCQFNMSIYTRSDIPKRLHYAASDRIDDIILANDLEWTVSRAFNGRFCSRGAHGYDNVNPAMGSVFIAYGPYFKEGYKTETFENIELYNLMCDIIGVTPAPNNGTYGSLNHILSKPKVLSLPLAGSTYKGLTSRVGTDPNKVDISCNLCNRTITGEKLQNLMSSLNSSLDKSDLLNNKHLPFGNPILLNAGANVALLYQDSHVTAFDTDMKTVKWMSGSIDFTQSSDLNLTLSECIYNDIRVPNDICLQQSPTTKQYSLLDIFKTNVNDQVPSTDTIPMLDSFRFGIWKKLQELVVTWSKKYGAINVISGPIFDYDLDGVGDSPQSLQSRFSEVPVASDIFMIVTRCEVLTPDLQTCRNLKTVSFILHHKENYNINCREWDEYLIEHESRVRDVELLTSLQFFQSLRIEDGLKLRLRLPHDLWPNV